LKPFAAIQVDVTSYCWSNIITNKRSATDGLKFATYLWRTELDAEYARSVLDDLLARHPDSEEAAAASSLLEEINSGAVSIDATSISAPSKNKATRHVTAAVLVAPANDPAPTDTQQEVTQGDEVGEISAKTRISRTFSIALFVIAGLAAAYLVSFFGDLSDSSEKVSSTLNTVAESEPFWGGLGAVLGGIGWFFVLIVAFIIAGPVAIIIMAIFGTGLIASSASDNPEKRGTVAKVARGCGITALWVSGLLFVVILSFLSA